MSKKPSDGKKEPQTPKPSKNQKPYSSTAGNKKTSANSKSDNSANKKNKPQPSENNKNTQKPDNKKNLGEKISFTRDNGKKRRKTPLNQAEIDSKAKKILQKNTKKESDSEEDIQELEPAKEPTNPIAKKLKTVLVYAAVIAGVLLICVLLSLTVFFKIDIIEVQGDTRYDSDKIISFCNIQKGDNLFLSGTSEGEKAIVENFPYIETATIEKVPFNKIMITVKEATPASIIESNNKYVVISSSGKILEINDSRKYNVPIVMGAKLKEIRLSSQAEYEDESVKGYVIEITKALEDNNIKDIDTINISKLSYIYLERKDGFKIILGDPQNIEYKISTAKAVLKQNNVDIKNYEAIDVTHSSTESKKSFLVPRTEVNTTENSKPETSKSSESSKDSQTSKSSDTSSTESVSEESSVDNDDNNSEVSETAEPSEDNDNYYEDDDNDSDDDNYYEDDDNDSDDDNYYEDDDNDSDDDNYYEDDDNDSDDDNYYEDDYNNDSDDDNYYEDDDNDSDNDNYYEDDEYYE